MASDEDLEVLGGEPGSALKVIPNVPLVTVGEWLASTGPFEATRERCMAAVAAQGDPGVIRPRVWAGHKPGESRVGEPALGIITEMRWDATTLTVYGDILTLAAIADAAPVLFPNRSVEAWTPYTSQVTGARYEMVIDGLALLGVEVPAVLALDDLTKLASGDLSVIGYGGDPVMAAAKVAMSANGDAGAHRVVAAECWSTRGDGEVAERVTAQIEMDAVWTEFYAQHEAAHPWWWIAADLVEPLGLIVQVDNGLARLAVEVNGDAITFGEPEPVTVQYVPKSSEAVAASAAGLGKVGRIAATHANASATRPAETTGDTMDPKAIREAAGVPADASDDELLAAIAARTAAGTTPTGDEGGDGDEPEVEVPDAPTPEAVAAAAAVSLPPGFVPVDERRLASLEATQRAHTQVVDTITAERVAAEVDAAIGEGRLHRDSRDDALELLAGPTAAAYRATLSATPKGSIVPVGGEVGIGADVADQVTQVANIRAGFPELANLPARKGV